MKKNKYFKKVMKFIIKFLHRLNKKNKLKEENRLVEECKTIEESVVINDTAYNDKVSFDRQILDEGSIKGMEKMYLIILIANYNTKLGYVEISNKEILSAVNGTNINTAIKIINNLIDKKFIRRLSVKNGNKNRYQILKYLDYSTNRVKNEKKYIEDDAQNYLLDENNILFNKDLMRDILIENQIIKEISSDISNRTEKLYNILSEYVEL